MQATIIAVVAILLVIFVTKLTSFFNSGGSLTMPARNATLMYRQICIVYFKMPEQTARFMALYLNSAAARDEIPESLIHMLVERNRDKSWEELCLSYTWIWAERVGHINVDLLPLNVHFSRSEKIREQIKFANLAVDNGDRRYESQLRSMPQSIVMLISAKAAGLFP